jgi:hypothetical protein
MTVTNENKIPVDISFEEDYKFMILNLYPYGCNEEIEIINNRNSLIDLCYQLNRTKKNTKHIINELVKYEDNKYVFGFLSVAERRRHNYKKAIEYLLKSFEMGCAESLALSDDDIYAKKYSLDKKIIKIMHKSSSSFLEKCIRVTDNMLFNFYDVALPILYEKNKQIEQLNEQHQKEIEELLRPGNAGALAAESRFYSY